MSARIALIVLACLCALAVLASVGEVHATDILAVAVILVAVAIIVPDDWHR